jgi:mRNA interferase MazF
VLTRNAAISVLHRVTVAPITTVARGIRTEVPVGGGEGLDRPSVINCDNLLTVAKSALDSSPVGRLNRQQRIHLNAALRYALAIAK